MYKRFVAKLYGIFIFVYWKCEPQTFQITARQSILSGIVHYAMS